VTSRVILLGLA